MRTRSFKRVLRGGAILLDRLLSFMDPLELAALSQIDHATNIALQEYFGRMFAAGHLLSPFFAHHAEFREVQSLTGAVVSGSAAVQLFDRVRYINADLDVYVDHRYAMEVVDFIRGREQYTFFPRYRQSSTPDETIAMALLYPMHYDFDLTAGIASVLDFMRGDHKVQLIVSYRSPMDVILNFHSTCVMNIITHNMAYSLFPRLAYGDRLSLTFAVSDSPSSTSSAAVRRKYVGRGFRFVSNMPGAPVRGSLDRWVGDRYTWGVPITPILPHLAADCMSVNAFRLVFDALAGTSINYDFFDGPRLKFDYVANDYERSAVYVAWASQVTKPRTRFDSDSVNSTIDVPFRDALYTCRFGAIVDLHAGEMDVGDVVYGGTSALRFERGGRSRRAS